MLSKQIVKGSLTFVVKASVIISPSLIKL